MNECIFCKIIRGDIPSYKVWEDENYIAFLSLSPHKDGHTLVIPKKHTDYFFDLSEEEIADLMKKTKPIAVRLKEVFKPRSGKVGVVVAGLGVAHVHVHLIPMDNSEQDLSFANARHNVTEAEFESVLQKIGQID